MIKKTLAKKYNLNLIKDTAIYVVSEGVNKGINFILLPILTFYIIPREMGIITNFNVFVQMLSLLGGSAFIAILPTIFYKKGVEINKYIGSLLVILFSLLLFLAIGVSIFHRTIENWLELDLSYQLLVLVTVSSSFFNNLYYVVLRLEHKSKRFAILQISQTIINVITAIILVVSFSLGAAGRIVGIVLSALIMAVFNFKALISSGFISLSINKDIFKTILLFGLPLIPHSIAFWLKGGIDKILITKYIGLEVNGIYSIAISMGGIFSIVTIAFSNSYTPYIQKKLSLLKSIESINIEKKRIVLNTYKFGLLLIIICIIGILLSNVLINYIIDDKYSDASKFTPWIFISLLFQGFYLLIVNFIYHVKKTSRLGIITLISSLIQVSLSYYLIREIGVMGACYSMLVGNVLMFIGVFCYTQRVYPLPWLIIFDNGKRYKK